MTKSACNFWLNVINFLCYCDERENNALRPFQRSGVWAVSLRTGRRLVRPGAPANHRRAARVKCFKRGHLTERGWYRGSSAFVPNMGRKLFCSIANTFAIERLALIARGLRGTSRVWSARGLAELGSECFCRSKAPSKTDLNLFFTFRGEKSEAFPL